jgi:hypothetical protein
MDGDGKAIRLTIAHKGNELRVLSTQTVRMLVPPSDQTYSIDHHGGFWFEVHSGDSEVLYRRVIPNPFVGDVEAISGEPDRTFTRVPSKETEKVSVLLVPVLAEGRELRLWASPEGAPGARARPIATLDLVKPAAKMTILATRETKPPRKKPRSTKKGRK